MAETLFFVGICSLVVGITTLAMAALVVRKARRSMNLAEHRMDYLREEQARLEFMHEERRALKEGLKEERRARLDVERRIDRLKRELQDLREVRRDRGEVRQENSPPVAAGLLETRGLSGENPSPAQDARRAAKTPRRPASPLKTAVPGTAEEAPPGGKRPPLVVWHPHPDDDVAPRRASEGQARARDDAPATPAKMFRKHYDRYLENYQGYVDLAERLYRMRDNGEVPPGSLQEREWEKRLRRVNDGIGRTTARLDILEEHNPELATDDRVSYRASVARRHSKLERSG
jgi:hypothetical protein